MPKKVEQEHGGAVNQWERGESGNPSGRPRKVLKELEEKVGVNFRVSLSKEDKFAILESMMEMSMEELRSIATDPRAPAFMILVASAIRKDFKDGRLNTINDLFDRFFGKAHQTTAIDHTSKGGKITGVEIIIKGQSEVVEREDDIDEGI